MKLNIYITNIHKRANPSSPFLCTFAKALSQTLVAFGRRNTAKSSVFCLVTDHGGMLPHNNTSLFCVSSTQSPKGLINHFLRQSLVKYLYIYRLCYRNIMIGEKGWWIYWATDEEKFIQMKRQLRRETSETVWRERHKNVFTFCLWKQWHKKKRRKEKESSGWTLFFVATTKRGTVGGQEVIAFELFDLII